MKATDFEKLYDTYYMKIYSFVLTKTNDPSLAEELTQKTFFKAMRNAAGYQGRAGEFTWLCAIAKNLVTDAFRERARTSPLPEEIVSDEDVARTAEEKDTVLRIHRLLHEMKEPYREVFSLRVFGELSFADIAGIFEKTESWARVTYHRARLKLIERMEEDG